MKLKIFWYIAAALNLFTFYRCLKTGDVFWAVLTTLLFVWCLKNIIQVKKGEEEESA